jgi:hypothetical protein
VHVTIFCNENLTHTWEKREICIKLWYKNQKEGLGIDIRIILNWIVKKQDGRYGIE